MKFRKALPLIASALAAAIAPDPVVSPAAWAKDHLTLADGPAAGQKWSPAQTPQIPGILDCLTVDNPATVVSVRKSSQVGMTEGGIAWLGSIIDRTPAPTMVVFPTVNAVKDFNRDKLQPTIEQSPALASKVREQKSRSTDGSTAMNKRFPGGTLGLTGANSAADLRSKTRKYIFADEIDEWPLDLEGQGDPMGMVDARQIAYHATGEYKKFQCSTPTIKGASRIDDSFEAGDQRYWHVPCPHCNARQRLIFKNLIFNKTYPFESKYACAECGALIEHHQKRAMVLAGSWVAAKPGPGRQPSFHLDALTSLLTTWDKIAETWWAAQGDHQKLKAFFNLWLGESWEERGEAPEWEGLYKRRSEFRLGVIPPGGLILTIAADVQKDGIYFEAVAWGEGKRSWSIDKGFLEGDTADPDGRAWQQMDTLYEREYPDAYGNHRACDAFGVDAGYNSHTVYNWTRRKPKAYALDGRAGWTHPPLGTPTKKDVTIRGRTKKMGVRLWPVGTWSLKAELYANLRKDGVRDGAETDPKGYCHFSADHDPEFFKQLTAEYIKEIERNGRVVKRWDASGPNHFHDCRVYNMALAEHLGVSRLTDEQWQRIAAERNQPAPAVQPDMAALWNGTPAPAPPKAPATDDKPATDKPAAGTWIERMARMNRGGS